MEQNYWELIALYLAGELSPLEEEMFKRLLETSPEVSDALNDAQFIWHTTAELGQKQSDMMHTSSERQYSGVKQAVERAMHQDEAIAALGWIMAETSELPALYRQEHLPDATEKQAYDQIWEASNQIGKAIRRNVPQVEVPSTGLLLQKAGQVQEKQSKTRKKISFRPDSQDVRRLFRYAAVITLVMMSGMLIFWTLQKSTNPSNHQTVQVGTAKTQELTLADGSGVWVNAASEFSYPVLFDELERRVSLKGEAFFRVASKDAQPFVIRTEAVEVRVVGTAFNVRAYPEDRQWALEVAEGIVEVSSSHIQDQPFVRVEAGTALLIDRQTGAVAIQPGRVEQAGVWRSGGFVANRLTLADVAHAMYRSFGLSIEVSPSVADLTFTGSFPSQTDPKEMLQVMAEATDTELVFEKNRIVVIEKVE